jgi:hemoglobin
VSRDIVRPPPDRDLDDREQVAEMVRRFYRDVAQDDLLGPMFNDVARVDWSEHLPKLTDFWCRMLFAEPGYQGNPLRAHQTVHAQRPFTAAHFERWLNLFFDTVELGWVGPNAEKVKAFATKVARVHSAQLLGRSAVPGNAETPGEAGGTSAPTRPPSLAVELGVNPRRC